jgi:hypothetical protein
MNEDVTSIARPRIGRQHPTSTTTNLTGGTSLSRLADQERYIGFFWTCYLPAGTLPTAEAGRFSNVQWTMMAQNPSNNVKISMVALSLCMLGVQHTELNLIKNGHLLFIRSLNKMRTSLQQQILTPNCPDERLLLARLLSLFTVNESHK